MRTCRWLVLLFVFVTSACGGCNADKDGDGGSQLAPPPDSTEFFEAPPDRAAMEAHVEALLAEYEPLVDADTRAAVQEFAKSFGGPAALDPPIDTVDAYLVVGEFAFMSGSASGAAWAFLEAVQLELDNVYALSQLGFILNYEERYDDARPFLLFANSQTEKLHTVLMNLGRNYEAVSEFERCVYFLERAAIMQPDNGEIRYQLAKCYFEAGQDTAGQAALDEADRLAPYNGDIAETAANPPESQVEDPGGGSILGGGGSDADAGKLIDAVGACFTQYTADYGEYVAPYTGFGGEFDTAEGNLDGAVALDATASRECQVKCAQDFPLGGQQDACIAGCLAFECASDSTAFSTFRRTILAARSEWSSKDGSTTSGYAGCAWPAYFTWKRRVSKFESDTARAMVWAQLDSAQESRIVVWDDVDERIKLWEADITDLCSQAGQALGDVDWDNPVYFDPFKDLDIKICSPLSDSFCLHMTNTSVSVTTPVTIGSPANLEFSIDARTGKFNATLTVPIASTSAPGGVVEGGANLKLDMEKGVGVQGEGKLGGPLNKTWSTERFLFAPQ